MVLPSLDGDKKKKSPGLPSMSNLPGLPEVDDYGFGDDLEDISPEIYDNEDFGSISADKVLDDEEDIGNEEIYEEIKKETKEEKSELPSMDNHQDGYYVDEDDYNPDYEEDIKKDKKFIDKKKKKLIPFGGKKSKKKKIKTSDFDERKNVLSQTKIIRFLVMLVLLVLFVFGVKNTFFPSHVYTDEQIRGFAREGAGQTAFPRERGEAFVTDFMTAFLTFDRARPELYDVLSYYYGEEDFSQVGQARMTMAVGPDSKQHIIIGPSVFQVDLLSDTSALYKVSTYVSNIDGTDVVGTESAGRWVSFSVNVYHDVNTDSLAITPDSPSVIPTYAISKQTDVPDRLPLGNGTINEEIAPALNPTINGFVQAYAEASFASHESVLQYISDKSDINLYDGFGGSVMLNGSPDTAIRKTIYNGDDGIFRVDVEVDWVDAIANGGEENQVTYVGRYIMRVQPEGNGKYSVSSFVPYTYFADMEATKEQQ